MTNRPPEHRRNALRLSQIGSIAARTFSDLVGELDLTAPEAGILRLLSIEAGISQRELAQRLGAVPSRVVVLLDSLTSKGLVERRRSQTDRRNHELYLTDAGRAMLRRLRETSLAHERAVTGSLSEAEQDELARLLAKLATAHQLDVHVHPGYRTL